MAIFGDQFIKEGIELYIQGKITKQRLFEGLQIAYTNMGAYSATEIKSYTTMIEKLINNSQFKSYNKFDNPYIKYDDAPPQIDYKTVQETREALEKDHGDTDMQGVDYIKSSNSGRKYSHMRRMLQKLWEIRQNGDNFDIDARFKLDCTALGYHMVEYYNTEQINEAHYRVRTEYKGRGRPMGARNKAKIMGYDSNTVIVDDPLLRDMPDDIDTAEVIENTPEAPKTGEMLDTSKFVTWVDFSNRVVPTEKTVKNICNDLIKIQAWGHDTDQRIEALERAKPTIIEIKPALELPTIEMGIQHCQFERLLKMVQAKLPSGFSVIPWVYGPAGTGKTTACENVAKALQTDYYTMGTTLAKFEILGFVNTTGYQSTPFRQAYEHGGIFCADEIDSWAKEATVAINGALANGSCNFADKMVKRHPNFIMIACANTTGQGATMDYVGRNKQDGATLDRFVYLNWPLDEALEDNLCSNKDWLAYVRRVRARAAQSGINPKPMITPRASMAGATLINAGLEWSDVVDMCLRKGLSDAQWGQIK